MLHPGLGRNTREFSTQTLAQHIAAVGATPTTLLVSQTVDVGVGATVTVPTTMRLKFLDGGTLSVRAAQTLIFEGPIEAGPYPIFTYVHATTSKIQFNQAGRVTVYPEWWGATGVLAGDDTVALQRMFDCASTVESQLECFFGAGKKYRITAGVLVGQLGNLAASYVVTGWGSYIFVDDGVGANPAIELGRSVEYTTTIAAGSNGAALPQATINVVSTTGFAASGQLRVVTSLGEQLVTYAGKTGTSFTGCAGGAGTMSTGGAVYGALQINVPLSTKLHRLVWNGVSVQRDHQNDAVVSTGVQLNACDFGQFRHCSFDRFYYGIRYMQEGGNSNTFDHISVSGGYCGARIGGLGNNSPIADAYNGNNWSWRNGKIQQCTIGLWGSGVGIEIEGVDFSTITETAVYLDTVGEARLKFYSEVVGLDVLGQTNPVIHVKDCNTVDIVGCRVNAVGTLPGQDCGYGIHLEGSDKIRIRGNLFVRALIADVLIDDDCGADILIDEDNYAVPITTDSVPRPRIADMRPGRIRDRGRDAALPRQSFAADVGEPVNVLSSPSDFGHASWTLAVGAALSGTTLAPDGKSLAQIVQFPNTPQTPGGTISLLHPTLAPSFGEPLDDCLIVLRFWWKAIAVLTDSTQHAQVFMATMRRVLAEQTQHRASGAFGGGGDWTFEEHVFAPADASPNGMALYSLLGDAQNGFQFSALWDGISVALWGVQLFSLDNSDGLGLRKHVPHYVDLPAGAAVDGTLARADKAGLDALAAGRTRYRRRTVGHADLTAAATSQSLDLGGPLAQEARPIGASVSLATPFSGGGAASCIVEIGTTGDDDAIVDGANVFAAAVDGQASTMPLGIAPFKPLPAASQLKVKVTSDVNVVALTAGAMTVELLYASPLGGSLFEPTELAGCTLWLPADAGAITLTSGKVSTWADRSGAGRNLVQATAGARPYQILRDMGLNGLPTVQFDGIDDQLRVVGQFANIIDTNGFSVYVLCTVEDVSTDDAGHQFNDVILAEEVGFWDVYLRSSNAVGTGTYSGGHGQISASMTIGRKAIVAARHDGAGFFIQVNGGTENSAAQGPSTIAGADLVMGKPATSGLFTRMRVAEVFIFNRKTTAAEHALCLGRLNALGAVY